MKSSGDSVLQQFGVTVGFQIDATAKKYLASKLKRFSKEVVGTTFDDIEKILTEGYEESIPYLEVKARLKNKFDTYEQYRTQLIVRTEVNSSMNRAEKDAIKQQGLDKYLKKHWLTSGAEDTRESHKEAERRYADGIPINEDFIVGEDRMAMPGLGSVAEENINCVCVVTYSKNDVPI